MQVPPQYLQTITLVTRTKSSTDSDGNAIYTLTTGDYNGVFAPAGSTEIVQGQDTTIDHDSVYLYEAIVADSIARVIVNGTQYEVDGTPEVLRSPFTNDGYTVIRLTKVKG